MAVKHEYSNITTEYSIDDMTRGTAMRITDWNTAGIQSVKFDAIGTRIIRINSRNKAHGGAIEDSRTFVVEGIKGLPCWISDATINSSKIEVESPLIIKVTPSNTNAVTEYSVDDVTSGEAVRIVDWNTNTLQSITMNEVGTRLIRVNSRNKANAGPTEDSRTFKVQITSFAPGYIDSAALSGSRFVEYPMTINIIPLNEGIATEFSVDDMTGGEAVRIVDWTTERALTFTPSSTGNKIYRINSRNKKTGGAIEDSRSFTTTIIPFTPGYLSDAKISASPYIINNPITITAIPKYKNKITEYSVDDMTSGTAVRLVNWTEKTDLQFYPFSEGKKIYRINSRNKYTGTSIEDSRTFIIDVTLKFSINYNTSTKTYGWSWTYPSSEAINILKANNGYYNYGDDVYLTFDGGYEYNNNTVKMLEVLKQKNVKAVFFLTGAYLRNNPEIAKRIVSEGHILGNHTRWHHSAAKYGSDEAVKDMIDWEEDYKNIFGKLPDVKLFRPAEGELSERLVNSAKMLGYKTLLWAFSYKDYDVNNQPSTWEALQILKDNTEKGDIILLHTVSNTNVAILGDYIDYLRSLGYRLNQFR